VSLQDPSRGALLVATALEQTWEAPDGSPADVVFLAPWCRRYSRRAAWEPLGDVVVADPWATPEALAAGIARVNAIIDRALVGLSDVLGNAHGERWTQREARILLGPWLMSYVPAQLDRWERLSLAVKERAELTAWGTPSMSAVIPADTLQAVQLLKSDSYNLQLMTPMMDALGIRVLSANDLRLEPLGTFNFGAPRRSVFRRAADMVARAAITMRGGRAVAMRLPHFPRRVQLELVRRMRLSAIPAPSASESAGAPVDAARRSGLGAVDLGDGPFERYLGAVIPRDVPTCFFEGYESLRAGVRAMGRCPSAILSANAWYYDESFKRWAANGAEKGSRLLGVQHGGNYGIDAYSPSEDHETAITDRYYTWGWMRDSVRAITVPMPAPKLIGRERLSADPAATGVLFVATSLPRYSIQLDHGPERFERYLARQGAFLSAVSGEVDGVLRVRPHRESLGWDIVERVAVAHPEVAIEGWDVPFAESLSTCRIFVCDHLSTTFAEALAVGKPTVLLWDSADTPIRAEAMDVLGELRTAGILFDDPKAAAGAVSDAYANVAEWWGAPTRVAAVTRFCRRFARMDDEAVAVWIAELASFTG